jgi:hypothetical protein
MKGCAGIHNLRARPDGTFAGPLASPTDQDKLVKTTGNPAGADLRRRVSGGRHPRNDRRGASDKER